MAIRIRFTPMIFLVVAVIVLLWLPYFFYTLGSVASVIEGEEAPQEMIFRVEKGEGLREISDALANAELIKSAPMVRLYSFLTGKAHKLKPGVYAFSQAMSGQEIIHSLVEGPDLEITVLIREGETLAQIDEKLASLGVIERGALKSLKPEELVAEYSFIAGAPSLEGFLFPDTYRFFFNSSAQGAAKIFLNNFERKVIPILENATDNYLEVITVASLIEAEVPDSAERLLVSGILAKRLKLDMPLQIDASSVYARENGEAYDTYKFFGLPPGPINNPGLDAISAALNPRASKFLYYLSDPETKKTIFSVTFEEHVANRRKYLPESFR